MFWFRGFLQDSFKGSLERVQGLYGLKMKLLWAAGFSVCI